jgi:putative ABC transport system permease protein
MQHWEGDFVISGILDVPEKTVFRADFLTTHLPLDHDSRMWSEWRQGGYRRVETFVLLNENADRAEVERKLQPFVERYLGPELAQTETYGLQPLLDIRLYTPHWRTGDRGITQIYLTGAAGVILLLIACVNFVNLSTALASRRAREVGIRKVTGAHRRQLIGQFLGEACLLSLFAGLAAILLAQIALPEFNDLVDRKLLISTDAVLPFVVLVLLVGVAAGLYPAFYLSAFQPGKTIKPQFTESGSIGIRRGLVIFQFGVSTILVVATLTVSRQVAFVTDRALGFDKDQVVSMPIFSHKWELAPRAEAIKATFLRHPDVLSASANHAWALLGSSPGTVVLPDGKSYSTNLGWGDEDVWEVYGFEIVRGRGHRTGTNEYVVNESAERLFADNDAIGQHVKWPDGQSGIVVGVVKDYHAQSLHHAIRPMFIGYSEAMNQLSLRISPQRVGETLAFMEATWKQFMPNSPFYHGFLDDRIDRSYHEERRAGRVSRIAAGMTVFVACLGLLGLATFAAERRAKEIGIRKVLGASIGSLLGLLSGEFLRLIIVSNLVAWPIAYWAGDRFLSSFVYRIDLGIDVFLLSGLLGAILALATVSARTLSAAISDPVQTLRAE